MIALILLLKKWNLITTVQKIYFIQDTKKRWLINYLKSTMFNILSIEFNIEKVIFIIIWFKIQYFHKIYIKYWVFKINKIFYLTFNLMFNLFIHPSPNAFIGSIFIRSIFSSFERKILFRSWTFVIRSSNKISHYLDELLLYVNNSIH